MMVSVVSAFGDCFVITLTMKVNARITRHGRIAAPNGFRELKV